MKKKLHVSLLFMFLMGVLIGGKVYAEEISVDSAENSKV